MIFSYPKRIYRQLLRIEQDLGLELVQNYLFQILTVVVSLVSKILIVRSLEPSDKGLVDLFALLSSFILEIGSLGFSSGLVYYLANRGKSLRDIHGAGVFYTLLTVLPALVLGIAGLAVWQHLFQGLETWEILLAFSLAPLAYYRNIWLNIVLGLGKASLAYRVTVFFAVLNLLAILGLSATGLLNVRNAILLTAVIGILNTILVFALLYRIEPHLGFSPTIVKDSLRRGFPLYLGFFINILHFRLDQLMISNWLGVTALAQYAVSAQWAETLFLLDSVITSVSLYKISSTSSQESRLLTQKLFKWQFIASGGIGLLLAIGAYPLIMILYGSNYSASIVPLILLVPSSVVWTLTKVLSQYIYYNRGQQWTTTALAFFGLCANVLLNFILLRHIGISGASIASSVSYALVFIATYIIYRLLKD
jgi:O-antigen/teichoic acid export membrane protein